VADRGRHAGKLGVVDLDRKDVLSALLFERPRLRASPLVRRPHSVFVFLRHEHDAIARILSIDFVERLDQVLPPKVLGIEVIVEDRVTRISEQCREFLGVRSLRTGE